MVNKHRDNKEKEKIHSAVQAVTYKTIKKADRVFYRQRRTMEDKYGMPHGTFTIY